MKTKNEEKKENFKINFEIPKRSVWSALALIITLAFTYIQIIGYLIPGFKEISILNDSVMTIEQARLIWVPVISYFLICVNTCLLINMFKKLKIWKEKGFIFYLAEYLEVGFYVSFIFSLFIGLLASIFQGFNYINTVMFIFIILIIIITTIFFILGFVIGLVYEFKKEK